MLRITWEDHAISLVEQVPTPTDHSSYAVSLNGVMKGTLDFLSSYTPGLAIGENQVIVWGGTRLYVVPFGPGDPSSEEYDDEVGMVYVRPGTWIVVGETSVALFDPSLRCATSRWGHNEVLIESWWTNDHLMLKDLTGRTFVATFDAHDRSLRVSEESDEIM